MRRSLAVRRAALLLALLAAGCRDRPPIPDHAEDLPDMEILRLLRERQAQVMTLVADGKGSLSGTKGSDGAFRWECLAQGTARIRLTLSHRLKGLLADASVEGDRAECWGPEARALERGPLARLSAPGLPQTVCLLRLLAGPADALTVDPVADLKGALRLVLDLGNGRRWRLRLDRRHLVYESAELVGEDGAVLVRVAFPLKGHFLVGRIPWPGEMVVDQPGEPWTLKLKFSSVRLGEPIEAEAFRLGAPEGSDVREIR